MIGSSEFRLLVAACHPCFARLPRGFRAAAPDEKVDWNEFLRLARRHRVTGLAQYGLDQLALPVPDGIAEEFRSEASAIAAQNLRIAVESAALLQDFQAAAIPLLFIKGLTVGTLAYRTPLLKMGWDVDVLVPAENLLESGRLLRRRGFALRDPALEPDSREFAAWHRRFKDSLWHRRRDDIYVELHPRLTDNPAIIPDIDAHSPVQQVEVATGVKLPTLARDELFAYLAVHGAASGWSRLKWLTDFAALCSGYSDEDLERLYGRSQELKAGRSAAQALLLASEVYGLHLASELRARLNGDPLTRLLVKAALAQLAHVREPLERKLGTGSIRLTKLILMPGPAYFTGEALRQVRDYLRPVPRACDT